MGAELQMTFPAAITEQKRRSWQAFADTALKLATRFWFVVIVAGQLLFAFTIASFYGMTAARGDFRAWSKVLAHGYIPGDGMGNVALAIHLLSAVIIILVGTLQLVPQIRNRFPIFHRWTGRLYIVTAFTVSLAGLYLMWARGTVGDLSQHIGTSLMAVLIMICAAMALRYALARDFRTHRRWALRLYLVVSASLFIRIGIFLSVILNGGPFGFDPATFTGPFLTFISFAQYLLPLGILELYLRAQDRPGALRRLAMAATLLVLTLAMGAGLFAVSAAVFVPNIKKAYDSRQSIAETLSATIVASGIDAAATQYHALKSAAPSTYNFDEDELNALGYQLLKAKKFNEAIRIFQLNVEAYPQSSNVYDSLGEAYMDNNNKPQAITNYQKSLNLNPKNTNAKKFLQKLNAP
jgi:tetratricopeptide (TPR) repeat protein